MHETGGLMGMRLDPGFVWIFHLSKGAGTMVLLGAAPKSC